MNPRNWPCENGKAFVCVDTYRAGVFGGRFINIHQETEQFEGLAQFLVKMDAMLDDQQIPQAYTSLRAFSDTFLPRDNEFRPGQIGKGELATFEVKVLFRQHSSWQGTLLWREKRKEQNFRSVLELVLLMDSAMRLRTAEGAA